MKTKIQLLSLFVLGMMLGTVVVNADLSIRQDITDGISYIRKLIFTTDGLPTSQSKVVIDGTDGSITSSGNVRGQQVCIGSDCRSTWPAGITSETDPNVNSLGKATLTCSNGQIAKYNGTTWICATDGNTAYSAGTGLSLNGTTFNVNLQNSTGSTSLTDAPTAGIVKSMWDSLTTMINGKSNTSTSISAGNGLAGGGDLSANRTISINTTAISSCTAANQKIVWSSANNRFECGLDADSSTTYGAGTGLTLSGSTFSVNLINSTGSTSITGAPTAGIVKSIWDTVTTKIGGVGTNNYIAKFNGTGNITSSQILDNGTNVGIGTSSPGEKFEVSGNIKLSGPTPVYRVLNVADPIDNNDAANKKYVDNVVSAGGGTSDGGIYLNNGEYYSVGGNPYYCKMFKLGDSQQFIKAINYRKPCDIGTGKFCNKNAECSSTLDPLIFSPGETGFHKCIIYGNAALCAGRNGQGQIGDSTTTQRSTLTKVSFLDKPVDINAGRTMTCAVEDEGTVKCWGQQYRGLGNGSTSSYFPVKVNGITNASKTVFSNNYRQLEQQSDSNYSAYDAICVLLKDGGVRCWGNGSVGQLGNGSTSSQSSPVTVSLGGTATKLYASHYFYWNNSYSASQYGGEEAPQGGYFCAIMSDTSVKCWGKNYYGMLGDGTTTNRSSPVNVKINASTNLTGVVDLSLSPAHACALLNNGQMKCWGKNYDGQIGNGNTTDQYYAVDVKVNASTNLSNIKQIITTPNWSRNNGLQAYSTRYCVDNLWGNSESSYSFCGQHYTTCAVTNDGYAYCWGYGVSGQMGNGTTTRINSYATQVSNSFGATKIVSAMGFEGSTYGPSICVLISEGGKVKCWGGYNEFGQIGDGNTNSWKYTPVTVSNLDGVTDLYGGVASVCAVINSEFKCWGVNNYGQLGNATTTHQSTPVAVKNLPDNFAIYGSDSAEKSMGSSSSFPTFCVTRGSYNGNLGGIDGANATCQTECGAGYKFADISDMSNFPASTSVANPWINTPQQPGYNCLNWTTSQWDGSNYQGMILTMSSGVWNPTTSSSYNCSVQRPLACVKGIR